MDNSPSLRDLNVPYLEQYFGVWAMAEDRFLAAFEHCRAMNVQLHLSEVRAAGGDGGGGRRSYAYEVSPGGVAIIDIAGTMMKQSSSMSASTSTVMMRNTLRQLAANGDIKGALIRIDSPGGTVAGTADLADEVAALAAVKPVGAYVEDLAASAAYWVASQAGEISAGRSALVGSIGTYGVVQDYSGYAAQNGIKVHVVRAGEYKGAGTPGTEITPAQLAEMQRTVNSLNSDFLSAVMTGRKLSADQVAALNDGRIHKAPDAKALGLIDYVESFDAALARMEARVMKTKPTASSGRTAAASVVMAHNGPERKETSMSQENSAPSGAQNAAVAEQHSATLAQLKAACPNAPSDFILAELEKGSTIQAAQASFISFQQAQIRAREEEVEKVKAAKPVAAKPLVTAGAGVTVATAGDAITRFDALVKAKKAGGMLHSKAVAAAVAEDPALHREYVKAKNAGKDRIVAEYFESADAGRGGRL